MHHEVDVGEALVDFLDAVPMILALPVIQLLVFGYAATRDVKNVRLALVDESRSPLSREIARALTASGTFQVFSVPDREAIEQAMLAGDAKVGLVVSDPASSAGRTQSLPVAIPAIELFAYGSEPNTAAVAAGYAQRILLRVVQERAAARFAGLLAGADVTVVPRVLYNPNLASRNYMVPGVLVMVLRSNSERFDDAFDAFGFSAARALPLFSRQRDWDRNARVLTDQYSPANLLNLRR